MPTKPTPARVERHKKLRWVPIADMRVNSTTQRELNTHRVNKIIRDFDVEQLGNPTVNERDGHFYLVDGQHRVEAMRGMGWGDQSIESWCYAGLSEAEEAEMFLKLNDVLTVHGFAKFKVGVQAGREEECNIDEMVRNLDLKVSLNKGNSLSCVATLHHLYAQTGAPNLNRTLRIVRDSYGDLGLTAKVIGGIGLLCNRYDSQLDDEFVVTRLSTVHGGLNALLTKADLLHKQTGSQRRQCVAAAAVEILNGVKGGRKLTSWWRSSDRAKPRLVAS